MIFLFGNKPQESNLMQGEVRLGKIEPETVNAFMQMAQTKKDFIGQMRGQEIYVSHHKRPLITILVLKPIIGGLLSKHIKSYEATTSREAESIGKKAFKYIRKRKFM